MESIKILHCADFHFDSPFSELTNSLGEKRKEDLRETFGKMVGIAREENVHLLFLCGDLFDNHRVSRTTIEYLIGCLREIPQIKVFIAPGNHDPYDHESYYHLVEWPQNVHIFQGELEKVELPELNSCVYGRGFTRAHVQESLLRGFTVDDPQKINMMVLHGDVVAPGQDSLYNPLTAEEIAASGLDYLALGHCHSYTGLGKAGNTTWAYPGCPEGRAFDETGEKGIIVGEVGKEGCRLDFRAIAKRRCLVVKVDLSNCLTYEQIAAQVLETVQELEPGKNLFKLVLQGALPEDFLFYPSVLKEKLTDQFYYLQIKDETTTAVDPQLLVHDFTLRGLFVKRVLEYKEKAADESERRKAEQALKYGLRILEQGEAGIE